MAKNQFIKLMKNYPQYMNLWESEAGRKQFGRFFDYLRDKYGSKDFDSERAMSVLSTARFKVDTQLIRSNWDIFKQSEDYNLNDEEETRLEVLKNLRDMIRSGKFADRISRKVEAYANGLVVEGAKYQSGFWRDARGRFVKKPWI